MPTGPRVLFGAPAQNVLRRRRLSGTFGAGLALGPGVRSAGGRVAAAAHAAKGRLEAMLGLMLVVGFVGRRGGSMMPQLFLVCDAASFFYCDQWNEVNSSGRRI